MMEMQEKTQADFDLEKLFEMMDEALTSRDERVQNALRGLLTIVELTRTQDDGRMPIETSHGPLRQMQEDLKDLNRRVYNLSNEVRQIQQPPGAGIGVHPYNPGAGNPYTWTTSKSSSSYSLTDNGDDATISVGSITIGK